jgi:heme exporter protein A
VGIDEGKKYITVSTVSNLNVSGLNTLNSSDNYKIHFEAQNLHKTFDRKLIFKDVSFSLTNGSSLAVTGKNGSGKSTLIKILAYIISQSSGELNLKINESIIDRQNYYRYIGMMSPYMNLYDEFTAYENLLYTSKIRGMGKECIDNVLNKIGLYNRRNDLLKIYSSGMKQRLKLAFSIIHNPLILLLDEPTSNLDTEGIKLVESVTEIFKKDKILIIATNDEHEKSLCESELNLNLKKD